MKPTTRLRILDTLRKYQTSTANELSRLLGLTGANIRYHLNILEVNDLIEVVGQRKEGRGRPFIVYGLSRRMLGDGLDELTSGMLDVWLGEVDEKIRKANLRSVAVLLSGVNKENPAKSVQRILAQTINRLNELHYQARWEASASGPRLILGHCPYRAIVTDHPELCQMDAYLLEAQLSMTVVQTEKLQPTEKSVPICAFQVNG